MVARARQHRTHLSLRRSGRPQAVAAQGRRTTPAKAGWSTTVLQATRSVMPW